MHCKSLWIIQIRASSMKVRGSFSAEDWQHSQLTIPLAYCSQRTLGSWHLPHWPSSIAILQSRCWICPFHLSCHIRSSLGLLGSCFAVGMVGLLSFLGLNIQAPRSFFGSLSSLALMTFPMYLCVLLVIKLSMGGMTRNQALMCSLDVWHSLIHSLWIPRTTII